MKLYGSAGSHVSTGWQTYADSTPAWQFEDGIVGDLEVGDYINYRYAFDAALEGTSGSSVYPTLVLVMGRADTATGLVTDVEKSEDYLNITFKLDGVDYAWSTAVSAYDYADGTAANGYDRAGRANFAYGYYTVILDTAGNVVRAVPAGESVTVYVENPVADEFLQAFIYNEVEYTVDLEDMDALEADAWYNIVALPNGRILVAEEAEVKTVVVTGKTATNFTYTEDGSGSETATAPAAILNAISADTVARFVFDVDGNVTTYIGATYEDVNNVGKVGLAAARVGTHTYVAGETVDPDDFSVVITFADGEEVALSNWLCEREDNNQKVAPEDYVLTENDVGDYNNFMITVKALTTAGTVLWLYNDFGSEAFFH